VFDVLLFVPAQWLGTSIQWDFSVRTKSLGAKRIGAGNLWAPARVENASSSHWEKKPLNVAYRATAI
jgi:hypothetical protein